MPVLTNPPLARAPSQRGRDRPADPGGVLPGGGRGAGVRVPRRRPPPSGIVAQQRGQTPMLRGAWKIAAGTDFSSNYRAGRGAGSRTDQPRRRQAAMGLRARMGGAPRHRPAVRGPRAVQALERRLRGSRRGVRAEPRLLRAPAPVRRPALHAPRLGADRRARRPRGSRPCAERRWRSTAASGSRPLPSHRRTGGPARSPATPRSRRTRPSRSAAGWPTGCR